MNTDYTKIKADLLAFGKNNGACKTQYHRLNKAYTIEEVIDVVKDNFTWCATYQDFIDVIMANREQFAEHNIFINQDVDIYEGIGCLLVTNGQITINSYGNSKLNIEAIYNSSIDISACNSSEVIVCSCNTSSVDIKSYEDSKVKAQSWDNSTISANSHDTSIIKVECFHTSNIDANSYDQSTIIIQSYATSRVHVMSFNSSLIYMYAQQSSSIRASSYDRSIFKAMACEWPKINAESYDFSTFYVTSYFHDIEFKAKCYNTSTMFIDKVNIQCEVYDNAIARYLNEDKVVMGNGSLEIEKYQ